jgi:hypothetical protein
VSKPKTPHGRHHEEPREPVKHSGELAVEVDILKHIERIDSQQRINHDLLLEIKHALAKLGVPFAVGLSIDRVK